VYIGGRPRARMVQVVFNGFEHASPKQSLLKWRITQGLSEIDDEAHAYVSLLTRRSHTIIDIVLIHARSVAYGHGEGATAVAAVDEALEATANDFHSFLYAHHHNHSTERVA
jgi:hypothetical protein